MLASGSNVLLLLFTGLGAGILSGFAGVGGSFIVTPALIIIGFPANFAVGTGLAWVMGNSVIGAMRHWRLGNIDLKLGLVMLLASTAGMEAGVRLLNLAKEHGLANEVVLSISAVMLAIVGMYTLIECYRRKKQIDELLKRHEKPPPPLRTGISLKLQGIRLAPVIDLKKSGIRISVWILVLIGLFVGVLAGVMGVGGGFIVVPALVYLVGMPSFLAVGTSLFQIVFSSAYGAVRHTLSGNVLIFAAFLMMITSSIGVQYGAMVTRYVRGLSVRYVLGISVILCAVGAALKLFSGIYEPGKTVFENVSLGITFGGIYLAVLMVLVLFIMGIRHRRGRKIPGWGMSFVASEDENVRGGDANRAP